MRGAQYCAARTHIVGMPRYFGELGVRPPMDSACAWSDDSVALLRSIPDRLCTACKRTQSTDANTSGGIACPGSARADAIRQEPCRASGRAGLSVGAPERGARHLDR